MDDAGGERGGGKHSREEEGGRHEEEGADLVRARAQRLMLVVRHCSPFVARAHGSGFLKKKRYVCVSYLVTKVVMKEIGGNGAVENNGEFR